MQTDSAHPTPVSRSSFTSADEDEVTSFIGAVYAEHSTRFAPITDGARFSALTHDVPALGADRVRTSIDYRGTSEEGFDDYVFFLVHAGGVHLTTPDADVPAAPGDVSFYPLHTPVSFAMHSFDVTTVRLPAVQVEHAAAQLLDDQAVRFHDITPVSAAMARYWRSLLRTTSGALMEHGPAGSPMSSPLLAAEAARTLAVAALHVFPNTTMTHQQPGSPTVAPAVLRRAVAYVDARAGQPVTLSEVAAAAGVSVRGLQYAFRHHLDTTPLGYLRRVRLERAHRDLQTADPAGGETVAAVAARWGFANSGRFTAAYREVFGVLPRQTLRT